MDQGQLPTQPAPFQTPVGGFLGSVGQYENHELHIREHLAEIRDPRFEQKPREAQMAYLSHLGEHRQAALLQLQQQLKALPPPATQPGALETPPPPEGGQNMPPTVAGGGPVPTP